MAQSRIEKFREYRKSIINNEVEVTNTKAQIETSLEGSSTESKTLPSELELTLFKKIQIKKVGTLIGYLFLVVTISILLIVFGLILF